MLKTWRLTGTRTCLLSAGTSTPLPPFQHLLPSGWPLDARDLPSLPQCHQQSSRAEFRASSLNPTTYRQQRSFTRAPSVPSKTYASITGCSGHAIVQEPAFTVLLTLPNEAWFRGKALAGKLPTCIAYAAQHSDGARARHRKNQIQVHTNKSVVLQAMTCIPLLAHVLVAFWNPGPTLLITVCLVGRDSRLHLVHTKIHTGSAFHL